ncbi:MAG: mevalonate kinase [Phycisphaerae bacterium]
MTDRGRQARLFVPGRLCLFGEHSDWAAELGRHPGYCLVIGTDQGLSAVATPSEGFSVETILPDPQGRPTGRTRRMSCPWDRQTLFSAARDEEEFFRYCAGVAGEIFGHPGVKGGVDLTITAMDLPLRKGVSSSAAVCILVAQAFDAVYSLGLFPHEMMDLAYRGEKLTGSQCGRMDQACIYGKTPVLLTFRNGDVRVEPVFPEGTIHMLFVDLAGQKDTVRILTDLRAGYPHDPALREALGRQNEQIVRRAHRALTAGDARQLGALMTEAQERFDQDVAPASADQLASPLLHEVLALDDVQPLVYGGKGVGSQGDGTAQLVARSEDARARAAEVIEGAFPQMRCYPLTILPLGHPRPSGSES